MRCLVTGGCGFIGSHVVELLLERGFSVTVLDNCSTGRLENISHLMANTNLKVVQIDIRDADGIKKYFFDKQYVFHLAALADIVPSIERPDDYYTTNVTGTFNVLQAAREANIKKFVYAASSSCYGIPDIYPTKECAEIKPQYPYALTKYLGEELVKHWGALYKVPYISLRLFNVYGPRSRTSGTYGAVFGVFLAQKLAGKPFTVVGDGLQSRDFTFVKDVARAFIAAAESNVSGEIMNVGSGNTYSVNYLAELLEGEKIFIPKRPGEPDCTFADIEKIKCNLDWKPDYSFEEGVAIVLKNIDYWKKAPVWDESMITEATRLWFKHLCA